MKKIATLILSFIFLWAPMSSYGESKSSQLSLVSDEETEELLTDWLKRFFRVGGVSLAPKLYLVKTTEINAGATFGGVIFVYTGLILKCQNASQLMGVLAHETGHIAGGHLAKASSAVAEASVPALTTLLLGGILTMATGNPAGIFAGLSGGALVMERKLCRHSRDQEDAADASALTYLTSLELPISGLSEFHDLLGRHYTTGKEDPYTLTHPLHADRKQKVQLYAKQQQKNFAVPLEDERRFQRVRAKLFGYLKSPIEVRREYPLKDNSIPAQYARLISGYVNSSQGNKAAIALQKLESLLTLVPNDPYFLEMQGQFMFECGRVAESLGYFEKALQVRPHALSIKVMYAHALIEASGEGGSLKREYLEKAIQKLTQVVDKAPEQLLAWRFLGMAYGKLNQVFDAAACLAEEAMLAQQMNLAKMQAQKGIRSTNIALKKRSEDILQEIKNKNG